MTLIAGEDLRSLIDSGVIDANPELINSSSIDITLGSTILTERSYEPKIIDIANKEDIEFDENYLEKYDSFLLRPGQFVLAHSCETFNLPNTISAEYKLKSSMARNTLNHLNAGWCDAGWNGSNLTLELVNTSSVHTLRLRPGMKIGQMVFFKHAMVPEDQSYAKKGRYNGDKGVSGSKGGLG
jgi:dCTP deaminase